MTAPDGSYVDLAQEIDPHLFPSTEQVFGEGGLLARAFPGYVVRPGQVQMTAAVDEAYVERKRLLAEGPTGTGKSVAYLVPAIRAALVELRRTVVVTSNIALQEQLVRKDLPELRRALGQDFRFAMLKGVSNYACREELEDAMLDPSSPREVFDVGAWAQRSETGDLSELEREPPPKTRQLVTTTSDDCLGSRCPSADSCFVLRARNLARVAQVLVVNYHLFFADLKIRSEGAERTPLPDYDAVVLDEIHNAAGIARGFFGGRLSMGSIKHVQARLFKVRPDVAKSLEDAGSLFFFQLEDYRRGDRYRARLEDESPVGWETLHHQLRIAAKFLRDDATGREALEAKKLMSAADTADKQAQFLTDAMGLHDPANVVYSVEEGTPAAGPALVGTPIDVAPYLRQHLWDSPRVGTVVGTSATLGDGRTFDLVAREVGADAAKQVEVPSPFDWPRQAMVVVPPGLPIPKAREWPAKVCEALADAVHAAGGRTLALFTSRKMLAEAARSLRAACPYRVLVQGEAPRTKLVEDFRRDVRSVLLGTNSLWEGVDVQGEACSCVVIDKLPFDSPDDPVESVLSERNREHFKRSALPRAVLRFRQGAGRLIRTATDRGVIVVLDDRIVSKPYGRAFLRGLPEGVRVDKDAGWADRVREFLSA